MRGERETVRGKEKEAWLVRKQGVNKGEQNRGYGQRMRRRNVHHVR